MIDLYAFVMNYIEESHKEYLLYGAELPPIVLEGNLLYMWIEGVEFIFEFSNGKVEKVWFEKTFLNLSISQKYNLTIQLCL